MTTASNIILLDQLTRSIHPEWKNFFILYHTKLLETVRSIDWTGTDVLPAKPNIFKVFEMNPKDIKVVLLGQDPYHGMNQATGLSFSVNQGITIPPSLYNIYKELKLEFPDRGYLFTHGDLSRWANEEKIFLLNSALTVEYSNAGSHLELWEEFTNTVIKYISQVNSTCVFLLLGSYAKAKTKFIERWSERCVCGTHPSPLSANRGGFFNTGIFKSIEEKIGHLSKA